MRSSTALVGGVAIIAGLLASPASAGTSGTSSASGTSAAPDGRELAPIRPAPEGTGAKGAESTGLWLVELASPPAVDGTPKTTLQKERDAFRTHARDRGLRYRERMAFQTLWNGLSVRLDKGEVGQLGLLRRTPGVKALYPVVEVAIPQTRTATADPDLATALQMTGADVAQSELGLSGRGVKVAVMDTGIDYEHPDLGGPGPFPTDRVVTGYDFVGDDYNAGHPDHLVPRPDADPQDCNGHGTHVSGIVGAEGAVTGVAPEVTFGAYKVFGCEGSTTSDIMIAAMERALRDDMDVLNMSIGSAFTWPQYPTGAASDRLVDRGMVVVASIGNSGANGVYAAGAPGLGAKVIGTASYDNSHISALSFVANPSGRKTPYLQLSTTPDPPTSGTTDELTWYGRGCTSHGDTPANDPAGKVALAIRGDCSFAEKYAGAVAAGATGVVIYNNLPGLFAGGGITGATVFGVGISNADGVHLREQLDTGGPVTMTWTPDRVNAPNPTGGLISSFSSYGLSPDLSLKPDIGAPGGLIRSTFPLRLGGYATISGTSMASPHVAGGAALLLEARPRLRAPDVRTILQNSANPALWWGNPGLGLLDNVHRQGAGMLDIPGAVRASTTVSPGKLALGEIEAGPATRTLRISNQGRRSVTYALSNSPALGTHGSTFAPSFNDASADVSFDRTTVTVPAGRTTEVRVRITAPPVSTGLPQTQYGGYLLATAADGTEFRVPYAGFVGDYQAIRAVTPTTAGFPWLSRLTACELFIGLDCIQGGSYANRPSGETYSLQTVDGLPDVPYILVHLDHQVRRLEMRVLDARTGRPVHPLVNKAIDLSHVGRNSTPQTFFAYAWNGTVSMSLGGREVTRPVPDGAYIIEMHALKALGSPRNPEHWESWRSPVITIDRP